MELLRVEKKAEKKVVQLEEKMVDTMVELRAERLEKRRVEMTAGQSVETMV